MAPASAFRRGERGGVASVPPWKPGPVAPNQCSALRAGHRHLVFMNGKAQWAPIYFFFFPPPSFISLFVIIGLC